MNYVNPARLIIYTAVLLALSTVVFNASNYSCANQMAGDRVDSNSADSIDYGIYRKHSSSPAEVIKEMQANHWLKERFSQWFVSPKGDAEANGTIAAPLDLQTALAGGNKDSVIKPGDIVWLRGGTYKGAFTVKVPGDLDSPIHIRQYPGERAILDKSEASRRKAALNVRSANVWFWDFEVANSFPNRQRLDDKGALNPWRGSGINVWAANTKYINLVIHDNGHGFGLWNEDGGTEIYGCVIFNNGNNKKEHGVYAHNKTGVQTIENNVIFNNAGYGLHVYANSTKSSINGFAIEKNTIFGNGGLMNVDQVADQILVGGVKGVSAERILVQGNVVFTDPGAPTSKNRGVRLGYRDENNKDVRILNNYIVSKVPLKILWWNSVTAVGNTIVSNGKSIDIKTPTSVDFANYKFEKNTYLSMRKAEPSFVLNDTKSGIGEWQKKVKFDLDQAGNQSGRPAKPSTKVFLNRNKYDKSRASITVHNPTNAAKVSIELRDFLKQGEAFEITDAQNVFGPPVLEGSFDGGPLILDLKNDKTTKPIGDVEQIPAHTKPNFAVFIVRKR